MSERLQVLFVQKFFVETYDIQECISHDTLSTRYAVLKMLRLRSFHHTYCIHWKQGAGAK